MISPMVRQRVVVPAVAVGMALLVLAPLLGRGFVLSYDMVFAPRQFLLPDSFGLGSALPRSVPADAVVGALTTVVPGDIVQKLLLFGALVAGPIGAARLVPEAQVVAAVSYGWTAYLAERLVMGHWPYLLTYAVLPWIVVAGRKGNIAAQALATVPAVLTPTGGILASVAACVSSGPRRLVVTIPLGVVLNAPWWVPAVLNPGGGLSATDGVAAFAARGENWGGPVLSLLGLGGIWNAEVVPGSRANPLVPILTVAVVGLALAGLRHAPWARGITILGAFGVLLAALPTLPGGAELLGWTVSHVPGGGLLRDSQKWVAWWALPMSIGIAHAVARHKGLIVAALLVPLALVPDFAFGVWGRLHTAHYPADWATVTHILATDPRPGDVVTQPFGAFRQFDWNGHTTQLDPAPRHLPRPTVVDDTLYVNDTAIPGEDPRAAAIRAGRTLNELGIGWVLVERGTPGPTDTEGLELVHDGEWLDLYRVPGAIAAAPDGPPRPPIVVAGVVAGATILICLLWLSLPAGRLTASHPRNRE